MNQVQLKILKYLSKHDDGNYHDARNAFGKDALPSNEYLETILEDAREYIEQESIYNYRGILTLGGEFDANPSENIFLKSKIKQKGREYLLDYSDKERSHLITKLGIIIPAIIAIIIWILS